MTTTYNGSLTIAEAIPGAAIAVDAGIEGINTTVPNMEGQLEELAKITYQQIDFTANRRTRGQAS